MGEWWGRDLGGLIRVACFDMLGVMWPPVESSRIMGGLVEWMMMLDAQFCASIIFLAEACADLGTVCG